MIRKPEAAGQPAGQVMRAMTVREFRARLDALADDELCCGTFWLAEDFLGINPAMTPDEIAAAMEYAEDHHDANEGFTGGIWKWPSMLSCWRREGHSAARYAAADPLMSPVTAASLQE